MNRAIFYDAVRASGLFGKTLTASQVQGLEGLLNAFQAVGDGQASTLAYGLATAYHETGARMVPVREGFATTDAGARRAVNNLAAKRGPNSAVAKYARPGTNGHVFYGRGHVQLTWEENYRLSSKDAGVDLVANPDAMLDPTISARVLFLGLLDGRWNGAGKGLGHYAMLDGIPGLSAVEAIQARRTVNGLDKAELIAGYHRRFLACLATAGGVRNV